MDQSATPKRRHPTPYPQVRRRISDTAEESATNSRREACDDDAQGKPSNASVATGATKGPKREAREQKKSSKIFGIERSRIAKYERTSEFNIPRLKFQRLCGEILLEMGSRTGSSVTKMKVGALEALQLAAEEHIEFLFGDTFLMCLQKNRTTVRAKDLQLARKIRGDTFKY
ncbi:unnamed protein product [Orchesella dallaii]|uniref:Core Histone H2A/H2B/H3 domain-containing protein n=1 Tax=Orchesella dallaii TaxID=48710 RepID=A0ABP1PXQ6_9HEXA